MEYLKSFQTPEEEAALRQEKSIEFFLGDKSYFINSGIGNTFYRKEDVLYTLAQQNIRLRAILNRSTLGTELTPTLSKLIELQPGQFNDSKIEKPTNCTIRNQRHRAGCIESLLRSIKGLDPFTFEAELRTEVNYEIPETQVTVNQIIWERALPEYPNETSSFILKNTSIFMGIEDAWEDQFKIGLRIGKMSEPDLIKEVRPDWQFKLNTSTITPFGRELLAKLKIEEPFLLSTWEILKLPQLREVNLESLKLKARGLKEETISEIQASISFPTETGDLDLQIPPSANKIFGHISLEEDLEGTFVSIPDTLWVNDTIPASRNFIQENLPLSDEDKKLIGTINKEERLRLQV